MHPLLLKILRTIYPLPDAALTREKPLEVLCLGLSRTGTESLRKALFELGYSDVHHGCRFILSNGESLQWLRLARAQYTDNKTGLTTREFDKVLGDCAAVTDQPICGFAHELLTAYPDAKVVLNYCADVQKWHRSLSALEKFDQEQGFYARLLSWFQSDLFWQQHVTFYYLWRRYFNGDFERNGVQWYQDHYRGLEERLQREGRKYLKWKVEDEWEPLCAFLDKSVPTSDFPNGKLPYDLQWKMAGIVTKRRYDAEGNLFIFMAVVLMMILFIFVWILGFLGILQWPTMWLAERDEL